MLCSQAAPQRGTTLIEAMIAAALSALFLGSLFAMNTSSMATIKMARDAACASQILQQRVESLRIANWHQITDAIWLRDNLLNVDAAGANQLKDASETLTLIPYGSSTPGNTKLTRANGSAIIENQNTALLGENALKIVWMVSYTGTPNDRSITRQTVAILAKGGVAK
jgi:Tfp pilus assembly protein PilV